MYNYGIQYPTVLWFYSIESPEEDPSWIETRSDVKCDL
jgi:hypothetical protein